MYKVDRMTDQYKCASCDKELDVGIIRLQQMIKASYELKIQNNKLIQAFRDLTYCNRLNQTDFETLHDVSTFCYDILKEIGHE